LTTSRRQLGDCAIMADKLKLLEGLKKLVWQVQKLG
jgi:hypothetical protein